MTAESTKRLIVVSNRLPYVLENRSRDKWTLKPGSGGLVTALLPVLRDRGGVWIGWSGTTEDIAGGSRDLPRSLAARPGTRSSRSSLTQEEVDKLLPRLLERERVAAVPRSPVPLRVRPRVLARLREGQPQVRRGSGRRLPPRRLRLGPRLPADGCGPPRARDGLLRQPGLLPAHPVPGSGHLHEAAGAARGARPPCSPTTWSDSRPSATGATSSSACARS